MNNLQERIEYRLGMPIVCGCAKKDGLGHASECMDIQLVRDMQARIEYLETSRNAYMKAIANPHIKKMFKMQAKEVGEVMRSQQSRIEELESAIESHLKYPLMGSKELKEVLGK